jgi:hypothetical protein
MLIKSATLWVAAVLLGFFPAAHGFATEAPYSGDLGNPQWFDMMRKAGHNSAMLRALAGSNGQSVVPPDCVEISGVFVSERGDAFKRRCPTFTSSRPTTGWTMSRSPFVFQGTKEPPNFYTVLKRDLNYDSTGGRTIRPRRTFCHLEGVRRRSPAGAAGLRARLGRQRCKISVYTEQRRAAK